MARFDPNSDTAGRPGRVTGPSHRPLQRPTLDRSRAEGFGTLPEMIADQEELSTTGALATMIGTGALMVAAGVAVIVIAVRAADGRLGPNGWAGIRTRATRASPEAWQRAHEAARAQTVRAGALCIATGVLSPAVAWLVAPDDVDRAMRIWTILVLGGVGVVTALVLRGARVGHRAARRAANPLIS